MTVTKPTPNAHDTTVQYVHREPSLLRRAVPWLVTAAVLVALYVLLRELASTMQGRKGGVGVLYIPGGWKTALLYLLGASGVLAVTSLIGQQLGQRVTGRKVKYLAVLGDQLTHLFMWLVVLIALFPIAFVLFTSFDPRNSLTIFPSDQGNLLQKAGLMPDLSKLTWANYRSLFDSVSIPLWQLALVFTGGASLAALILLNLTARVRGSDAGIETPRRWFGWALVAALALIIIFMSPAQFAGEGNESRFLLSVRNTMLISGLTGVVALLLSTTAGYAMARLRFPGRFQTLIFFIFIQMFPVFLGLVAIKYLLFNLGVDNSFTGLILAYSGGAIAFNTWIFKGYVESLPESLEEAAMVDGATRWQTFVRIVLPLSTSMLVFIFLNQFIGTYAEYVIASQVLTGVEKWSVGIMLQSFTEGQFNTKWGIFAAAAVTGALPIVALFYSFQQYFVGGALAGGVKE